jgi:hypothetical protein
MNRKIIIKISAIAIAASFAAGGSAHASYDDDIQFTTKGFLEKLKAFVKSSEKKPGSVVVALDFNGQAKGKKLKAGEREPGYLYFTDIDGKGEMAKSLLGSKPNKNTLVPERDINVGFNPMQNVTEEWVSSSFTPRSAGAELSISYTPKGNKELKLGETRKSLDLALSSNIQVKPIETFSVNPSLTEALSRTAYDFGVNIGYSGFNLGANMRREQGSLTDGYVSYDVGLSYQGRDWSTTLLLSESSRSYDNLMGIFDQQGRVNTYAVELGGTYRLNRIFDLSGGLRWFNTADRWTLGQDYRNNNQLFYLGTKVKF